MYRCQSPNALSVPPPQVMQQLYQECNLVHADLSEYNMLWHDGKVRLQHAPPLLFLKLN